MSNDVIWDEKNLFFMQKNPIWAKTIFACLPEFSHSHISQVFPSLPHTSQGKTTTIRKKLNKIMLHWLDKLLKKPPFKKKKARKTCFKCKREAKEKRNQTNSENEEEEEDKVIEVRMTMLNVLLFYKKINK